MRFLLVAEGIAFATASLIHAEVILPGNSDSAASTAEGIIAAVLVTGAIATWVWPRRVRAVAISTQLFALAGTSIGLYLFVRLQPERVPDIVFHVAIWLVLAAGIAYAVARGRPRHSAI